MLCQISLFEQPAMLHPDVAAWLSLTALITTHRIGNEKRPGMKVRGRGPSG
jgi:hypothetical protein